MDRKLDVGRGSARWAVLALAFLLAGCLGPQVHGRLSLSQTACDGEMPRELRKTMLPPYVIEPPDVLLIDAIRVVPLPPYKIEPLDALFIQATGTKPGEPVAGIFVVSPEGMVDLGFSYGSVSVVDLTLEMAQAAVENQLRKSTRAPQVTVSLAQSRGRQQIRGEHLVRQDGMVSMGVYGEVAVAGLTVPQARAAIEAHLSKYLLNPEVSVSVAAYNSKVYYVIADGGGFGKSIVRLPVLGNETVLDALAQINGVPAVGAHNSMWIARPAPDDSCRDQILPVDLVAITEHGSTATNYQIFPGDRVYIKADPLITTDNWLAKVLTPIERVFGVTLLGAETVNSIKTGGNTGTTNR